MTLSSNLSSSLPQTPGAQRISVVRALLGGPVGSLLDIGSGRVAPDYPYLDLADRITCVDWNPRIISPTPEKIEVRAGNFLDMDIPAESYDATICADVFEHVPLVDEAHGPASFNLALVLRKRGLGA